jgi:hypothetical protein
LLPLANDCVEDGLVADRGERTVDQARLHGGRRQGQPGDHGGGTDRSCDTRAGEPPPPPAARRRRSQRVGERIGHREQLRLASQLEQHLGVAKRSWLDALLLEIGSDRPERTREAHSCRLLARPERAADLGERRASQELQQDHLALAVREAAERRAEAVGDGRAVLGGGLVAARLHRSAAAVKPCSVREPVAGDRVEPGDRRAAVAAQRGGRVGEHLLRQVLRVGVAARPAANAAVDLGVVPAERGLRRVGHDLYFAHRRET